MWLDRALETGTTLHEDTLSGVHVGSLHEWLMRVCIMLDQVNQEVGFLVDTLGLCLLMQQLLTTITDATAMCSAFSYDLPTLQEMAVNAPWTG